MDLAKKWDGIIIFKSTKYSTSFTAGNYTFSSLLMAALAVAAWAAMRSAMLREPSARFAGWASLR
jgi:hypothetical protein